MKNLLLVAFAAVLVACGSDSLVGGGCREGLSECRLKCVNLDEDPNNCGACGHVCGGGDICFRGGCASEDEIWALLDGGGPDGQEASVDDAADAGTTPWDDGSNEAATGNEAEGDGNTNPCAPPFDSPAHCGDCFTQCSDPTPVCGLQGSYKCLAQCEAPLEACGATCVDKFSDENNCGECGNICPSGICQKGACVGAGFGHEVVIGMDYSDSAIAPSSGQMTMLTNAVLLSNQATVRALVYDEFADGPTVSRIEAWLANLAAGRNRALSFVSAGEFTSIPSKLAVSDYEVFLVFDQTTAPAGQMATTGTLWNGTIDAFAKGGGVIVALDGGTAGHMLDLLTNGGLLPVTDEASVTGTQLNVVGPTDGVGLYMPNVLAARKNSVSFTTSQVEDSHHAFVVKDEGGTSPVVIHSVP